MHRSRIGVVLLDHPTDRYDDAAAFWAAATGSERAGDDTYESLRPLPGGELLELQRTGAGTAPRLHLDIETDDVPAEIDRVIALGASIVQRHEKYAVLTAPGGLLFCVVPVQSGAAFDQHAVTWP